MCLYDIKNLTSQWNTMPGGNRRLPRTARNAMPPMIPGFAGEPANSRYAPLASSVPNLPVEQPASPKHFPFPNSPVDDELYFEMQLCFFTIGAAGFQFIHLYRTVWWLPHSYNNTALNFYLIDFNLVTFILIVLIRRLLYIVGCNILKKCIPEKSVDLAYFYYRLLLFGFICLLLATCAYFVMQVHPLLNIMYLCYPVFIYMILFGLNIAPFFELINWKNGSLPPLHACSSNAVDVRQEVENLKSNFNNRMKQILFTAVLNAYYAGFIPCCFAQNVLQYDIFWATQHAMFIFLGSFVALAIHILSLRYCDILHRSALHLGNWDKLETRNMLLVNNIWKEEMLWPYGALVRYGRDIYRAQGECNASEPGNAGFSRFYIIFKNPSFLLSVLLGLHLCIVIFQLVMLVKSTIWYKIISLTFVLFFNYNVLFKICRDYLVSSKIYREEQMMHNKLSIR